MPPKPRQKPPVVLPNLRDKDHFASLTFGGMCFCFLAFSSVFYAEYKFGSSISFLEDLPVQPSMDSPLPKNEGKPIIATGKLSPLGKLEDEYVKPPQNVIVLVQLREKYPWSKKNSENSEDVSSKAIVAPSKFGNFKGQDLISAILESQGQKPLEISESMMKKKSGTLINNAIYFRKTPDTNSPGDERVTYKATLAGEFTVVGIQSQNAIKPLNSDLGFLIVPGNSNYEKISKFLAKSYLVYLYIFRFYGLGLLWLGFMMLLLPFRGKFKNMSLLDGYTRALPFVGALSTTMIFTVLIHESPKPSVYLISLLVFFMGVVAFILLNRDTPKVNRKP